MRIFFKVATFLVCFIALTQQTSKFSKTKNIFEENVNVKNGDVMQCQITKTDVSVPKYNSIHVFTSLTLTNGDGTYVFHPIANGSKCFSFDVRTKYFAHIAISDLPVQQNSKSTSWLEAVLQYSEDLGPNSISVIRTEFRKEIVVVPTPNILSENELKGFWIRCLDDELLEVGRESEDIPFMSYRNPTKLSINYIGVGSYKSPGEWILHGDSKCPNQSEITEKITTESNCFILSDD